MARLPGVLFFFFFFRAFLLFFVVSRAAVFLSTCFALTSGDRSRNCAAAESLARRARRRPARVFLFVSLSISRTNVFVLPGCSTSASPARSPTLLFLCNCLPGRSRSLLSPPSLVRQRLRVGGRWPRYAATSLAFVPTVWFTRQLASVEGGLARRRFFCSRYEVQSDLVDRRRRRARARVHSDRRARCRRRADTGRGHVGIDEVLFLTVGLPARPRASTTEANPSVFFFFFCLFV